MYEQLVRERKEVAQLHTANDQDFLVVSSFGFHIDKGLMRHTHKVTVVSTAQAFHEAVKACRLDSPPVLN